MIEYQVDEQMLEEVQAKLGEMSRKSANGNIAGPE